jgi:glutamate racemase
VSAGRPSASAPVGFFDSGLGGRCILSAFQRLCPFEHTVYLADSSRCPYGNRPPEEVVALSRENVDRLLAHRCKLIVVACNTATAAAIDVLRAAYPDVPFVGIEPAVKPAALKTRSGVVGVLATMGTFNGRLYRETMARCARGVSVLATVADEFVTLVEKGQTEGPEVERIVRAKVEPLLAAGADYLVLGCTHFPHLRAVIARVAAGRAEIVDPSEAVARQAARLLSQKGLSREPDGPPTHVMLRQ